MCIYIHTTNYNFYGKEVNSKARFIYLKKSTFTYYKIETKLTIQIKQNIQIKL